MANQQTNNTDNREPRGVSILFRSEVLDYYGAIANREGRTLSYIINRALLAQRALDEQLDEL